ncbi:hypothetical protein H1Q63_32505 [Desmonostoc muscorum CCALA 125]|nr:hypothetical protein [Desmonostoc muscorum CCALA 125]
MARLLYETLRDRSPTGSQRKITNASCPIPHAPCPILRLRSVQVPNAQYPMTND